MKISLKNLVDPNFVPAFRALMQEKLAVVHTFALAKSARLIDTALADYNAARMAFFQTHGTPLGDPPSQSYSLANATPEVIAQYNAQNEAHLATEIDLPIAEKIPLPPACSLIPAHLYHLLDLVAEPSAAAAPATQTK